MSGKVDKKIRKVYKTSAIESAKAFKAMVKRLSLKRRIHLAWKVLINNI